MKVETTICDAISKDRAPVALDHVALDECYASHPTPAMYGFESYVSVPIVLPDGSFFGTLCAIHARPARVNTPETERAFPFDSDRKRSSVVRRMPGGGLRVLSNGAPEALLLRCDRILSDAGVRQLTEQDRTQVLDRIATLSAQALRVLGSAYRDLDDTTISAMFADAAERDMVFVPEQEGIRHAIDIEGRRSRKRVNFPSPYKLTAALFVPVRHPDALHVRRLDHMFVGRRFSGGWAGSSLLPTLGP